MMGGGGGGMLELPLPHPAIPPITTIETRAQRIGRKRFTVAGYQNDQTVGYG